MVLLAAASGPTKTCDQVGRQPLWKITGKNSLLYWSLSREREWEHGWIPPISCERSEAYIKSLNMAWDWLVKIKKKMNGLDFLVIERQDCWKPRFQDIGCTLTGGSNHCTDRRLLHFNNSQPTTKPAKRRGYWNLIGVVSFAPENDDSCTFLAMNPRMDRANIASRSICVRLMNERVWSALKAVSGAIQQTTLAKKWSIILSRERSLLISPRKHASTFPKLLKSSTSVLFFFFPS